MENLLLEVDPVLEKILNLEHKITIAEALLSASV